MKAIILAAGRGSRLGDLTETKPKCLTELLGKTLLDWQIQALIESGIKDIGIVRGYKKDKINIEGVSYFDNDNWNKTNMVMSLYTASEWLERYDCIISYSDIVYNKNIINFLKNSTREIAITYNTNWLELWNARFANPLSDAETFKVDDDGRIIEIGKKAKSLEEIKGQYMGLIKIKPDGWKKAKCLIDSLSDEERNKLDMTSLLNKLIDEKVDIFGLGTDDLWLEVDSQEDLMLYKSWDKKQILTKLK